jgi:hypothetical protein
MHFVTSETQQPGKEDGQRLMHDEFGNFFLILIYFFHGRGARLGVGKFDVNV